MDAGGFGVGCGHEKKVDLEVACWVQKCSERAAQQQFDPLAYQPCARACHVGPHLALLVELVLLVEVLVLVLVLLVELVLYCGGGGAGVGGGWWWWWCGG